MRYLLILLLLCPAAWGSDSLYNIPPIVYDMEDVCPRIASTTCTPTGTGVTCASNDTTYASPLDGGPCIKFVTSNAADTAYPNRNSYAYIQPASPVAIGTHVGLLIRVDNAAANTCGSFQLKFFYGATNNYGNNVLAYAANYGLEANKWKILWIRRDQFTAGGTPAAWATTESNRSFQCDKIFIQVATPGDNIITYYIGGIVTYTPTKAKVILCMDDGYASAYTEAYTKFKAHGWRGCVGVNSALVENPGFATLPQLQEMHGDGWDMCNHTSDHTQGTFSPAVLPETYVSKVAACKKYQLANGLTKGSDFFIAPGNILELSDHKGADYTEPFFLMGRGRAARTEYGPALITTGFVTDTYATIVPADYMNIPFYSLASISQTEYAHFGGVDIYPLACTIDQGADGKVRITKTGAFAGITDGWIPFVDFSNTTYADGFHTILSHTDDSITIDLAYSSAVPTCSVLFRDAKAFINNVTLHRGVGIIYAHKILSGTPGASNISIEYFDALIADLTAKETAGTLEVITFSDWWNQIHKNPTQTVIQASGRFSGGRF